MIAGIIANPASGKDIRRLVAHATVFDNQEKVNLIRRILLGLQAAGVQRVWFMPDYFGFYERALDVFSGENQLTMETKLLPMQWKANQEDSQLAAAKMVEMGVSCLVTLGGDGTNRVVSKGAGEVPIMPVSTGTNNVFSVMVEGTIAGLAAGLVATGAVEQEYSLIQTKKLIIYMNGKAVDIALIDAVVLAEQFVGSRAIWDIGKIRQIVATCGESFHIGIAAIVGALHPINKREAKGINLIVSESGEQTRDSTQGSSIQVKAAVGPGLIRSVPVRSYELISPGQKVVVRHVPCVIAVDGEREIFVGPEDCAEVELVQTGPFVVDVKSTLNRAAKKGLFINR
ncbi:ATP-NAD kinase family protein [Desulfosporosinus nitroreducens]|uniref:ATP-NAD kinase family protein n=1 Tax=Desulfosporosinus nitroreducens TaxID=2018668 RepID=UPI00207D3E2F|nr:NAD(+)/NADH kinase [Desulfosporosinus nitroreducens]MCO1600599.1 NAD(+)/NADH kinase [Desulfosporosinus nitroreducens]